MVVMTLIVNLCNNDPSGLIIALPHHLPHVFQLKHKTCRHSWLQSYLLKKDFKLDAQAQVLKVGINYLGIMVKVTLTEIYMLKYFFFKL